MANNIDKPLHSYYDDNVDPDTPDVEIEFDLPEFDEDNVFMMEDGSALITDEEEAELPPIENTPHTANLVAYFEDDELNTMSDNLIEAWEMDNEDRKEWREIYKKGLELLGMKIEERTEPFDGASGVHHPLLAEAVIQFQAQAYKELLPANGPVQTKVLGAETPERMAQAARIKEFMNYQILEVMEEYDENMDQLLLYLPLGGSAFKKTYYDPIKQRACSEFVTAEHVTIPYKAKDLTNSPRVVHDFYMDGNTLLKYQASGFYSDEHEVEPVTTRDRSESEQMEDELSGVSPSSTMFSSDEEYLILEAHLDLDHELLNDGNGVVRPYVMTVDKESGTVLAIRRNWIEPEEIIKPDSPIASIATDMPAEMEMGEDIESPVVPPYDFKHKLDYFTHYKFLPGLGAYGFGLIHMIGGLTTSATSILRQLIDAGTFANLPGGLKAKGMRVDGDDTAIAPGEWRDVDVVGGVIRDNILPLPYKEPSVVLFQLLGALVDSGQRFASIADMNVGDVSGSQQQPVGTTIAMLERGTKVMSSIHKRLHKAQKHEFKILARIIKENISDTGYPYATKGQDGKVMAKDFDGRIDIIPVSDPNIFSMAQRVMLASQQLQMAQAAPKVHNVREAYRRMYVAMGIEDVETVLKPEQKAQRVTPAMEHRKLLMNQKLQAIRDMNHEAHIQAHLVMLKHPVVMQNIEFTTNLLQDIMGHIGFIALLQTEQQAKQSGQQLQPGQKKPDSTALELQLLNQIMPQIMPPQPKDPMAELQKRQLDITEKYNDGKLNIDEMKAEIDMIVELAKLASKENQVEAQLGVDMDKTVLGAEIDFGKEFLKLDSNNNTNNNGY